MGGLLVDHASWRWIFFVNLPLGAVALAALRVKLPSRPREPPSTRLDSLGAALLAGATATFMLVCVWGGDRYGWGSAQIVSLIGATLLLAAALAVRERRAADPIVPFGMLRAPVVRFASVALFLGTASLFAVTVFVPLFLQASVGLTPTHAGLLLVAMMVGTTASTTLAGRAIARTGRYKRFPLIGLTVMAASLALLAAFAGQRSAVYTGIGLALFGLGFGLVSQVLVIAVQNSVERRELGVATAVTSFFPALGGSAGAAVLGAVFAAHAGGRTGGGPVDAPRPALRAHVADSVQIVFLIAAPLALLALIAASRLPETELKRGNGHHGRYLFTAMAGAATRFAGAELTLPAELSRLPDARGWADAAAEAFGFDEMVRYQIKMAVSEGVANAVEHGSSSPTDEIHLRAVPEGDALAFYVRDSGRFIPRISPRGEMPERGRGLAFLGQLMDEVDIKPSDNGTVLRFCKRLEP